MNKPNTTPNTTLKPFESNCEACLTIMDFCPVCELGIWTELDGITLNVDSIKAAITRGDDNLAKGIATLLTAKVERLVSALAELADDEGDDEAFLMDSPDCYGEPFEYPEDEFDLPPGREW